MQELERIRELVHEIAGVPGEQVTPESTVDSLNLDSLDVTELILSVEDEFGIIVDDESSIHSVGDLLSMLQKTARYNGIRRACPNGCALCRYIAI